jgi:hypothetical protein
LREALIAFPDATTFVLNLLIATDIRFVPVSNDVVFAEKMVTRRLSVAMSSSVNH